MPRRTYFPRIEKFEDRIAPATFLVTVTSDNGGVNPASFAGTGTLRQAILDANATPGADAIHFAIGSGLQSIAPLSALPAITEAVNLDATTQPGFAGTPIIELDGSGAGAGVSGLTITGAGSTIRGLVINRFSDRGVLMTGTGASGNVIAGNYVGTDATGTAARPNTDGVAVYNGAHDNRIGGTTVADRNLISGNYAVGVSFYTTHTPGVTGNIVEGNYIGTNAAGTAPLSNGYGVSVNGYHYNTSHNTIGGTSPGAGNLISGNGTGVWIDTSHHNTVIGNLIGTDVTGSAALDGSGTGVVIRAGSVNNTIGGLTPAARNIISGNQSFGVLMINAGTTGNVVQGNYVGTDVTGTFAVPNRDGVVVGIEAGVTSASNLIGGTVAGAGNVISGNAGTGLMLDSTSTARGNLIGTDATGMFAVPNQVGVGTNGSPLLGGTTATARNVISGNGASGVACNGGTIQGNYIGLNKTGTAAVPNGTGIIDFGGGLTVGGNVAGAGNVISGNTGHGIALAGGNAGVVVVAGNMIGTDPTGTTAIPNRGTGIQVPQFRAAYHLRIGTNGDGVGDEYERNVISGNSDYAIDVCSTGAGSVLIAGN